MEVVRELSLQDLFWCFIPAMSPSSYHSDMLRGELVTQEGDGPKLSLKHSCISINANISLFWVTFLVYTSPCYIKKKTYQLLCGFSDYAQVTAIQKTKQQPTKKNKSSFCNLPFVAWFSFDFDVLLEQQSSHCCNQRPVATSVQSLIPKSLIIACTTSK